MAKAPAKCVCCIAYIEVSLYSPYVYPYVRDPRQSWILDFTQWIPDSWYWIPVFVSRTWIPDSNPLWDSGFPWAVFPYGIPKPRISDSNKPKFPGFPRIPESGFPHMRRVMSRFFFISLTMIGVEENRSLYQALRYIEVRYIEVPLQLLRSSSV